MAKVEQDIEVEIDIPKSLKFKKTVGKIKYALHEEEIKLIIDIKKIAKEIKRLQNQLNDANKTIKEAQELCPDKNVMLMCNPARPSFGMMTNDVLTKYLKKWGVK